MDAVPPTLLISPDIKHFSPTLPQQPPPPQFPRAVDRKYAQ